MKQKAEETATERKRTSTSQGDEHHMAPKKKRTKRSAIESTHPLVQQILQQRYYDLSGTYPPQQPTNISTAASLLESLAHQAPEPAKSSS